MSNAVIPVLPGQLSLADLIEPVVTVTRSCYGSPREWRIDYADGRRVYVAKGDRSGYYRVNGGPQELALRFDSILSQHDTTD